MSRLLSPESLAQHVPGWSVSTQLFQRNAHIGMLVQLQRKCMICMRMHEINGAVLEGVLIPDFIRSMQEAARAHEHNGLGQ